METKIPETISFEDALKKLEEIVKQLELGSAPLDKAINYYQEGIELSDYCTKMLAIAEQKVTLLVTDKSGNTNETNFEMQKD